MVRMNMYWRNKQHKLTSGTVIADEGDNGTAGWAIAVPVWMVHGCWDYNAAAAVSVHHFPSFTSNRRLGIVLVATLGDRKMRVGCNTVEQVVYISCRCKRCRELCYYRLST
jgi:hypothetical protein